MQLIFLIGPPGSGKTAVGLALSQILSCEFFDTDRLIEAEEGLSIREIFAKYGEPYFRTLEQRLVEKLERVPNAGQKLAVVATGGGLPVYNDNISRLLQLGKVVTLSADIPVLASRLSGSSQRPLLDGTGKAEPAGVGAKPEDSLYLKLKELINQRWPVYDRAGYKIDTSDLKPAEAAEEIARKLEVWLS